MDPEAIRWEGYTAAELRERWSVNDLHLLESVGSTNDFARRLAERGAPAGTVILADEQRAGRGRSGRTWSSPPGLGLWISLVLRPIESSNPQIFPLLVGLAAARALERALSNAGVSIKWPNDLMIDGRKVAGILCEGVWSSEKSNYLIVGVGVNVSQRQDDFPAEIRDQATSLAIASGPDHGQRLDRERLAADLVRETLRALVSPPPDLAALAPQLESRDALRGNEITVTEPSSGLERARGTALGIAADGALLLRSETGTLQRIRSGTVRLTRESAGAPAQPDNSEHRKNTPTSDDKWTSYSI